jgi:hypothetical protein
MVSSQSAISMNLRAFHFMHQEEDQRGNVCHALTYGVDYVLLSSQKYGIHVLFSYYLQFDLS